MWLSLVPTMVAARGYEYNEKSPALRLLAMREKFAHVKFYYYYYHYYVPLTEDNDSSASSHHTSLRTPYPYYSLFLLFYLGTE